VKLVKTLDLLARPTGFEPVTLGLEMRWIMFTNCIELWHGCDKEFGVEFLHEKVSNEKIILNE